MSKEIFEKLEESVRKIDEMADQSERVLNTANTFKANMNELMFFLEADSNLSEFSQLTDDLSDKMSSIQKLSDELNHIDKQVNQVMSLQTDGFTLLQEMSEQLKTTLTDDVLQRGMEKSNQEIIITQEMVKEVSDKTDVIISKLDDDKMEKLVEHHFKEQREFIDQTISNLNGDDLVALLKEAIDQRVEKSGSTDVSEIRELLTLNSESEKEAVNTSGQRIANLFVAFEDREKEMRKIHERQYFDRLNKIEEMIANQPSEETLNDIKEMIANQPSKETLNDIKEMITNQPMEDMLKSMKEMVSSHPIKETLEDVTMLMNLLENELSKLIRTDRMIDVEIKRI